MTSPENAGVHRYAIFVVVCTFLLLIAGALVTSNEAALSVPDWPLSYGTLTPPMVGVDSEVVPPLVAAEKTLWGPHDV